MQNQLVDMVLQRITTTSKVPHGQLGTITQCLNGFGRGSHYKQEYTSSMPKTIRSLPKHWCQLWHWNVTHDTQNFLYLARIAKEQESMVESQRKH